MSETIRESLRESVEAAQVEDAEVIESTEVETPVEPEYTETEQIALDSGWKPEGKDKDGNSLSADEYMARKPLFNKIHNMKSELDEMKAALKSVQGDSKKMAQKFIEEKENLLVQLKEKKEAALDTLDTDEVRRLDTEIEAVSAAKKPEPEHTQQDWKDSYLSFLRDNEWYDTSPRLKAEADTIGDRFVKDNPNDTPDDLYRHVVKEIKDKFADKFEAKKETSSKVTSSTRRASVTSKKKGVTLSDLPEDEQRIVQVMANAVGKTTEEYLKCEESNQSYDACRDLTRITGSPTYEKATLMDANMQYP